jgi:hypothetical protein
VADQLRPDTRPKSRWTNEKPSDGAARTASGDRQGTVNGSEIRARLLKMIVENEKARKPKSQ